LVWLRLSDERLNDIRNEPTQAAYVRFRRLPNVEGSRSRDLRVANSTKA